MPWKIMLATFSGEAMLCLMLEGLLQIPVLTSDTSEKIVTDVTNLKAIP